MSRGKDRKQKNRKEKTESDSFEEPGIADLNSDRSSVGTGVSENSGTKTPQSNRDKSFGDQSDDSADNLDDGDDFLAALDNLSEKRSSTRVEALKSILTMLRNNKIDVIESIESNRETVKESLCKLLRRPNSELEGLLALKFLSITCLALGPEEDEFVNTLGPILKTLVTRSEYDRVREAAVGTLALLNLICSSAFDERVLDFLGDVLNAEAEGKLVKKSLQAAASSAWCLLATVLPPQDIILHSRARIFAAVSELLRQDTSTETRIAAGLALAYLWEAADKEHPGLDAALSGFELCDDHECVESTLDLLRQVARESSKRVSKRDRKEQRAAFRPLEAWVCDGEKPEETVQLQGTTVVADSFARLCVLDALRDVLEDGFVSAARVFPVVRDVLGVEYLDLDGILSGNNRVTKGSSEARGRTTQRKQDRRHRDAHKHSRFASGGFEDEG